MYTNTKLAIPTAEDALSAKQTLERTRIHAAVHTEMLLEKLTVRALEDSANFKTILDAFSANKEMATYLDKQVEARQNAGFTVNITIPQANGGFQAMTITTNPTAEMDPLADIPTYTLAPIGANADLIYELQPHE